MLTLYYHYGIIMYECMFIHIMGYDMKYKTEYDETGKPIAKIPIPENAKDVRLLRHEYNRRNAGKPGFRPSVEYVVDPNDPTKRIPRVS